MNLGVDTLEYLAGKSRFEAVDLLYFLTRIVLGDLVLFYFFIYDCLVFDLMHFVLLPVFRQFDELHQTNLIVLSDIFRVELGINVRLIRVITCLICF